MERKNHFILGMAIVIILFFVWFLNEPCLFVSDYRPKTFSIPKGGAYCEDGVIHVNVKSGLRYTGYRTPLCIPVGWVPLIKDDFTIKINGEDVSDSMEDAVLDTDLETLLRRSGQSNRHAVKQTGSGRRFQNSQLRIAEPYYSGMPPKEHVK